MIKILSFFDGSEHLRLSLYLLLFLSLVLGQTTLAQSQHFTAYGAAEGLSQEYVNTIIKDHRGFIWIGTQDGLNRFDAYEFKVFKKDKKDSNSLSGNFINAMIQDRLHRIWIGTKNNGLCYYDYSDERFHTLAIEGLTDNAQCNQLTMDERGQVYAAFLGQGIVKIQAQNDSIDTERLALSKNVTTLKVVQGLLLAGTREGEIYYADTRAQTLVFEQLNHDFRNYKIHTFAAFEQHILVGSDEGLFFWDRSNNQVKRLNRTQINNAYVYDIAVGNDQVFLATDNGLFRATDYSEANGFSKVIHDTEADNNGLISNLITHLLLEKETLWLGGNRLYHTSLEPPIFKTSPFKAINNSLVYTIAKHETGNWIGTAKGLYLATDKQLYFYTEAQGLPHEKVRHLAIDNDDNLWVGTQKGIVIINLNKFDPEQAKLQEIPLHPMDAFRLQNLKIRDLHVDKAGSLWVATLGGGVHRFIGDLKTGDYRFQHFKNKPDDTNSLNTNVTYALYQDRQNTYWIGTEKGVNTLRFEDGDFNKPIISSFIHQKTDSTTLSNNTVLSFLEDRDGDIWIGTLNGLNQYLPASQSFKTYDETHGLTNGVIYAILEDTNGKLWLSTNTGLFCFDKKSERFTQYSSKDGLQNDEYTLGATWQDDKGQLYFGGGKGFDYFHPNDLTDLGHKGQLVFTDLKVDQTSRLLDTEMIIAHDAFPVYLKFSDLNYNIQKNSQYVYQLAPKDQQWNDLQGRREIQFLSLAPGNYELLIQGKTRTQIWDAPPLKLHIIVRPPWWQSPWMYALYLFAILGIGYGLYRFLLSRKLQEEETKKLREINALKTQLYTNITHEFRTPITVIKGLTNHLKSQLKNQGRSENGTANTLDTINHNTNQVLNLVDQLLDLAKVDRQKLTLHYSQSDIVWFIERIVAQFSSYASSKGIAITFYSEAKDGMMDFDVNALQKVMSNLLSNAIKNSEKGDSIIIHTRIEKAPEKQFIINVKDTGKGIQPADLPRIFDRFYQASNGNGTIHEGSGIGLSLTKELVHLMKGRIQVKSEVGKGSTFIVTLPVTNEANVETQREEMIDAFAIKPTTTNTSPTPEPIQDTEAAVVLVVDDNEDIIDLLKRSLKEHYQILTARNGQAGIEQAIKHIPDVIISDVMMPETNGYELCETLKSNDKTSHIPIILLTAKATDQDRLQGLSKGADAFITKPFQKAELFIRIQELIKLRTLLYQKYTTASAWETVEEKDLKDKDTIFINSVLQYIEQYLEDPQFNSARLAQKLQLSESQLYRKLKAITNTSTANFIRKVRLQKAKSMLQSTEMTVSEIAYQTGFSSPSWFSRAFKQEFGYAPNELRN